MKTLDDRRQPQPVKVRLEGEMLDVYLWLRTFERMVEGRGHNVEHRDNFGFTIYHRAIND